MTDAKKNISIRNILLIVFILSILLTAALMGYLVYTNWANSARIATETYAEYLHKDIFDRIEALIPFPEQLNEANHKIIENGILDLSDENARDRFFAGVLLSQGPETYSFSYGTADGEYYGARRNENGVIEIMRNNADTGGNYWYYSVKDDLTAGERVVEAGLFDPRTRAWYKAAAEAGDTVFSPIYKHFVMDDMTFSVASPVYNSSGELLGVLGTHMLLSGIGDYLEMIVQDIKGYAFIIEKDSGQLIANSLKMDNFTVLDGQLIRYTLADIDNPLFQSLYAQYGRDGGSQFLFKGGDEDFFVNTEEYHKSGLDWVIISLVPESLLTTEIFRNINLTIIFVVACFLLSLAAYFEINRSLFEPMGSLLRVSEIIVSGNLSERVPITRNDEIGKISAAFNKLADKLSNLINGLEESVKIRTEELELSKDHLRQILDSTAEAIYGMDVEGNCTFCNASCIRILRYRSTEDLLGKNMHIQLCHSNSDGTPVPIDECSILTAVTRGEGCHSDSELFRKADGTAFHVEYHAYPQIKNGKVVGAVITFTDISDRKRREEEIRYLSCHDTLTGLFNRRCFEENRGKIDIPENLPLSIIFGDINGLKMTNDIFGHAAGDALIKKSSEILRQSCGENDVIARVGGDEFIILMPRTDSETAEKVLASIKSGFSAASVSSIKRSISLGSDTKKRADQSFEEIMSNAENAMYKDKTINRKSNNNDMINMIIETLHLKSISERRHSIVVSELCADIGAALNLPEPTINKLKRAGYLHDIGKIVLDYSVGKESASAEDLEKTQQHPVTGYRILNLFDDTLDLAEDVYSHHERWDGTGYPRGLKGEDIPLLSRIISVAEVYERLSARGDSPLQERKEAALQVIKENSGKMFDPEIAELFARMMGKRNG